MKIKEIIHNIQTGEITEFERDETQFEKAQREKAALEAAEVEAEARIKATERAAILERLGLTEEEAKLLLG